MRHREAGGRPSHVGVGVLCWESHAPTCTSKGLGTLSARLMPEGGAS